MKAKKISLKSYKYKTPTKPPKEIEVDAMCQLLGILFSGQQRLNSDALRRMGKIANEIESGKDDLILSIDDYKFMKKHFDSFQGLLYMHRELERRITNPEEIEMKEEDTKKK